MTLKHFLAGGVSALAFAALLAPLQATAHTHAIPPLGKPPHVGPVLPPYRVKDPTTSGTWTDLVNPFPGKNAAGGPDTSLLMTDGTVIMHLFCSAHWYRLTPDKTGNYVNGTWKQIADLPAGYFPAFFATSVLPDADSSVMMNGGEYNDAEGNCGGGAWTTKGAVYNSVKNTWTAVNPPSGWANIGDAQSVVLPNGQYMLADCCSSQEAIATGLPPKLTWASTGTGKADENDEEGWTNLPGGNLLTVDANKGLGQKFSLSEIYNTATGAWSFGGDTASDLVDTNSHELGPAVLRPDGTVLYIGATGNNNIYTVSTGTWSAGPSFPVLGGQQYDEADGPAVLLPDGNVLLDASPGVFNAPSHFFEVDTNNNITQVNDTTSAPTVSSFEGRFLELPTGQVLWSNDGQAGTPEVAIYTPVGSPQPSWAPVITASPKKVKAGKKNYAISGNQFNGWSQGASYGDDAQEASNYPIVRIINNATSDVCYARSHDFSTMGVQNTAPMNAKFDVPKTCETGASTLQVVVNGIASTAVAVKVK